jgi:hypothetical protein
MNGWVNHWTSYGQVNGWDGLVDIWKDRWVCGWMDRRIDGQMDRWDELREGVDKYMEGQFGGCTVGVNWVGFLGVRMDTVLNTECNILHDIFTADSAFSCIRMCERVIIEACTSDATNKLDRMNKVAECVVRI